MKKYLLWDHDGVLVDTEKWYFLATKECLSTLGCEIDEVGYLKLMAEGRGYWDAARQRGHSEEAIAKARRQRDFIYQEFLRTKDIEIQGVADVVSDLSAAYRMAIVTTARREDFELIHRSRQIRRHFEFVITADDCATVKPLPEPYEHALRRFNAHPSEAFAIEDSSRGLRSALAAGIDCVIVRNEFTAGQDFGGAWHILSSIRELPTLLAKHP